MKIIIIDSVDLSGKDYFIEKFVKFWKNGYVIKNTYKPFKNGDTEIFKKYIEMLNLDKILTGDYIIFNRCYPSEAVYSILRGKDRFDSKEILDIEKMYIKKDVYYIYIYADDKLLEERYKIRGDEHVNIEQIKMLKKRYDIFFEKTNLKKIKLMTTDKAFLNKAKSFLKRN